MTRDAASARTGSARAERRIAVLTGGGDCPGLNAVIRAVVKTAGNVHGWQVYGVQDGFEGFLQRGDRGVVRLDRKDIAGILPQGGTILGASNRCDIFAVERDGRPVDESARVAETLDRHGLSGLVLVGGEGTHIAGARLAAMGLPVVGVPKTIDNDLGGTDVTFGFDTAVGIACEAIDRLHSTAASHHRVMCLEVMGRHAGWIALHSGISGGADVILLPEVPYDPDRIARKIESRVRHGRRFSIVVVAEGAKRAGGAQVFQQGKGEDPIRDRLGGVSFVVAEELAERTGVPVRNTVLGHVLRGGTPSPFDRVLATRFGVRAVRALAEGETGVMVALRGTEIVTVPIAQAVARLKLVDPAGDLVRSARELGISFAAADGGDDAYAEGRARHGAP
jgi:6-phosphofructokinase 1